ncbi:hypothetical protein [Aeromonas finlandensis]|uniref:hypothetical protein n=1 Tax=Aeromonas finlandensis TaxID=1543375 RepID=UPI00051AF18A|nr:hypothetical protein [Aeromonas finlandensis]
MLMTEYPLHYWQGKGVFTSEIHGEEFMEFKVSQVLGAGNSALKMMILAQERAGRDMGACRAELDALQQFTCLSEIDSVVVLTGSLGHRRALCR